MWPHTLHEAPPQGKTFISPLKCLEPHSPWLHHTFQCIETEEVTGSSWSADSDAGDTAPASLPSSLGPPPVRSRAGWAPPFSRSLFSREGPAPELGLSHAEPPAPLMPGRKGLGTPNSLAWEEVAEEGEMH